MRISDWSSDVCSSDLETFLQVASLQQAAPGIVDKQFAQMREFLAAAGDSEATQTFRENFAESLLARALNQHNGAIHAPGLAMQIAADSGDPDMARSEEHTSELQSLMRNSYAVFCLKKKNHNTIHNIKE